MNKKWMIVVVAAALCVCLGIFGGKAIVSSEEEAGEAVVQESGIREESLAPDVLPAPAEKKELPVRTRFISVPEIFRNWTGPR